MSRSAAPYSLYNPVSCGAGSLPYTEWGKRVRMVTGGLSAASTQIVDHSNSANFEPVRRPTNAAFDPS